MTELFSSIGNSAENNAILTELVCHREELLDQMKGNFGRFKQDPAFMDTDWKYTGFHFKVKDIYVDPKHGGLITMSFDKRSYALGFTYRRPVSSNSHWCRLYADFNIPNSKKFIELCARFLDTFDTEIDVITESNKIDPYWEKLKSEIFVSI